MSRVSVEEVKALFRDESPDVSDGQVENAIETANHIVDSRVASAVVPGTLQKLGEATLVQVEKYLAAHFVALIDVPVASESVTVITDRYQQKVDLGLLYTLYGQQAVLLDATGTLQTMTAVKGKAPTVDTLTGGLMSLDEGLLG